MHVPQPRVDVGKNQLILVISKLQLMRNVIILVKAKDNLLLKLCQDKKLDLSYRDILDLELVLVQHKLQVLPHKLVPKTTLFQIREQ